MPIGELTMHYALKNHILQLQYNWIILKHYENMPIQIYRKFHPKKLKIFR